MKILQETLKEVGKIQKDISKIENKTTFLHGIIIKHLWGLPVCELICLRKNINGIIKKKLVQRKK